MNTNIRSEGRLQTRDRRNRARNWAIFNELHVDKCVRVTFHHMDLTKRRQNQALIVTFGNMVTTILFVLAYVYTDWLQWNWMYFLCYFYAILNIFFLFQSFPTAMANPFIKTRGLFFMCASFIASNIICFAVIYERHGIMLNEVLVHDKQQALYFSMCNFINRESQYVQAPNCSIEAAFQTLLGLVAFAYLVGIFIDVIKTPKPKTS